MVGKQEIDLKDGKLIFVPNFYNRAEANVLFENLHHSSPWRQDDIFLFGKQHKIPRLQAWYGDEGTGYSYSGIQLKPLPWTNTLNKIKSRFKNEFDLSFNSVLLNLYRHGADSNGWHADDETELGQNPIIASISLGAARAFHMKHKIDKSLKQKLILEHGSLLIMAGKTQHSWKHQIPKTKKDIGPRINLTFRKIIT